MFVREQALKVFLDDLRRTPPGWQRARTAWEVIEFCEQGNVKVLSLDYDLDMNPAGYDEHPGTGQNVTTWLLKQAQYGQWEYIPECIVIHSSNFEGVGLMSWDLAEIERMRWARAVGASPEEAAW